MIKKYRAGNYLFSNCIADMKKESHPKISYMYKFYPYLLKNH